MLALDPQEQQALLDEGRYLGSVRTMYRSLASTGGAGERRRQLTHPAYVKPELLATGPNQVWSWDITKSHTRPHVSDDNPYSESQFKTMKYRPDFPARVGCIADARAHCRIFFA